MEKFAESLGGLIIVTGAVLIVYFISRYNYLIKKMLAEKGLLQKTEPTISKKEMAYVAIGLGIGLLISAGLALLDLNEDTKDSLVWGIVLIFGAIGLLMASSQGKK